MIDHFYSEPKLLEHWRHGPLWRHMDGFADLLVQQGYSRWTGRQKLRLIAQLSQWLKAKGIRLQRLDEQEVAAFKVARRKRRRPDGGDSATLALCLRHLRRAGVVPAAVDRPADGPIDRLLQDYTRFLVQERGLSEGTWANRLPVIRDLLHDQFRTGRVHLNSLQPRDISGFVLRQMSRRRQRQPQLVAASLRSFLRFLYQHGRLARDLSAAVPTVASWRSSELPRLLKPAQIERVLQRSNQTSPCGRRDYAVLLLLARLGLRAGEVRHLTLDDINWATGEVLVRGKSAREDRLPLPPDVGRALAAYLKHGRPPCSSRRVFLRAVAPHEGFAASSTIALIVRRALARVGIHAKHQGAHLLRHSLATRMLRGGASLAQIGQILRHRHTQATEVYAKVDLKALRALTQPWPGGVR